MDDEIIAEGTIWRGQALELRQRMANFTVDGDRYGTLLAQTRSGSVHDRRLSKKWTEIATAAFVLGRLGYEGVQFFTKSRDGADLERPDLDARFATGEIIGIEAAEVGTTSRMKHDSHIAVLEHTVRDLIEADAMFAEAFGPYYVTVSVSNVLGDRDVASKKQAQAMLDEVIAFIRSGGHRKEDASDPDHAWFGDAFPTLRKRGATYYVSEADYGPYFGVMDGGTVNPNPETDEIQRVLDSHRRQARGYRMARTWMLMYLPDSNEIYRRTVPAFSETNRISPPSGNATSPTPAGNLATITAE